MAGLPTIDDARRTDLTRRIDGALDDISAEAFNSLEQELSTESVAKVGIFSRSAIQGLVRRHLRREANLGYHLWGLLTLHLWVKRWNIATTPASEPAAERADAYSVVL